MIGCHRIPILPYKRVTLLPPQIAFLRFQIVYIGLHFLVRLRIHRARGGRLHSPAEARRVSSYVQYRMKHYPPWHGADRRRRGGRRVAQTLATASGSHVP